MAKRSGEDISKRSHLPKLVTQTITKLINVPVLQDHDVCGLSGCLYNLSLGMVDNMRRFEMPGQHGDPMIAEICAMPPVRGKLVLNIMDGLIAGYAGGPGFKPQYSWNYGALYFSTDPVAIDSLCVEALDAKRREAKVPPIGSLASHIATAALPRAWVRTDLDENRVDHESQTVAYLRLLRLRRSVFFSTLAPVFLRPMGSLASRACLAPSTISEAGKTMGIMPHWLRLLNMKPVV